MKTLRFILFILLACISGCKKDSTDITLPVKELVVSDCKNHYSDSKGEYPESVSIKTADQHYLAVTHNNSFLNCAPGEIKVSAAVNDNIVTIWEEESSSLANCICPYDISFRIGPIQYSDYKLIINRNGLTIREYSFTFNNDTDLEIEISQD